MEFFSHPWLNERAIEKRAYQNKILTTALKENTLCVLPTGTGKTAIAALVAAHRFEKLPDAKILVLAPTKPLARQHRDSFEKFLKIGPDELRVVTGATKPEERAEEYKKAWVVFATPQTISNDIKNGTIVLNNFSLLIVDEGHRSIGNYAYTFIARRYMEQAKNPLILGLTASPGADRVRINQICQNLFTDSVEIRTEKDEDVSPYVKPINMHWVKVELPAEFEKIKDLLKNALDRRLKFLIKFAGVRHLKISKKQLLVLQGELRRKAIEKKDGLLFQAMSVAVQCIKIQHALELAQSQGLVPLRSYFEKIVKEGKKTKAVRSILEDKEIQQAVRLAESLYQKKKDHPKFDTLQQILTERLTKEKKAIIFTQYVDTVGEIVRRLRAGLGIKVQPFIGQRRGVTQKRQIETLKEFRDGLYNVIVATSIGEEGLDIPAVDLVIFYEPIPSEIRAIQRRGRTGRFAPGEIFILMAKGTIDEGYYWAAHHKEKRMKAILYDMQEGKMEVKQKSIGEF